MWDEPKRERLKVQHYFQLLHTLKRDEKLTHFIEEEGRNKCVWKDEAFVYVNPSVVGGAGGRREVVPEGGPGTRWGRLHHPLAEGVARNIITAPLPHRCLYLIFFSIVLKVVNVIFL